MSDKAKIISIKFLIERYKKEIEKLKENNGHKDPNKIQTISVLRDITFELENILNN